VRRLVLASDNPGKLREFSDLLVPFSLAVLAQGELGIRAAEEPHPTFVENALAKARHAATASGLPALADDSGLCCEELAGAPGVRSARFAGEPADDARNNEELLRRLDQSPNRRAHYVCVLVLCRHANDPEPLIAEGRWHGRIAMAPRGAGGFGYDPLFELPDRGLTVAELPSAEKNRISHRALALQDLAGRLRASGQW
jgi:XTP/dITP diphosphohydrolase